MADEQKPTTVPETVPATTEAVAETKPAEETHPAETKPEALEVAKDVPAGPVFDHNKVTVIFVLGGPGAGACLPCTTIATY